jgi:hypothetical protein
LRRLTVVPLVNATSKLPLELCRDDGMLKAAGLGLYSSTLERWFFSKSPSGEVSWLAVQDLLSRDASERAATPPGGEDGPVADFNVGAGLMLLRKHYPISVESFLNWLRGSATIDPGAKDAETDASPIERPILNGFRWQPLREHAWNGDTILESAYLRVQLWYTMAREVHALSSRLQTPFLNLTADSFRISLDPSRTVLRTAWPFRTVLVHPSDAVNIHIGDGEAGFAPLRGTLSSPHALPKFGGWLEGSGTLRIRQVSEAAEGRVRLDGVLDGNEIRNVVTGCFVWVQTQVDGRSVNFFAKIEGDKGNTRTGVGFAAPSVELASTAGNRLKAATRHPCQYVILRPVSPVFDIYSLGVIGVRIFLTDDRLAVNDLVDDIFELAAILPQNQSLDDLRRIASASELSDRLRRLLAPPDWARDANGGAGLAENVWLSILRELIEFVTAEVPLETAAGSTGTEAWIESLTKRLASLEETAAQLSRLVFAPRRDHDEIARIVHSFV